jgi:hypothetical protein
MNYFSRGDIFANSSSIEQLEDTSKWKPTVVCFAVPSGLNWLVIRLNF